MSDPRVVSALTALADAYDVAAARRRLAEDAQRMPRPPVLQRPKINTFRAYDPTRPVNPRRAGAVPVDEISPYRDAPDGESFWLMLVGALGLCAALWLLLWVVSLA